MNYAFIEEQGTQHSVRRICDLWVHSAAIREYGIRRKRAPPGRRTSYLREVTLNHSHGSPKRLKIFDIPRLGYFIVAFVAAVSLGGIALVQQPATPQSDTAAASIARDMIVRRLKAVSANDADAYRRLVSVDFIHVDDAGTRRTVAQLRPFIGGLSGAHPRYKVGAVYGRRLGSTIIADGDIIQYIPTGSRELRFPLHETDVFILQRGQWLFLNHQETHILTKRKAARTQAPLDDFVGMYQWHPGFVDTITRRADHLFSQETGDPSATELLPASNEAFYADGDPSIVVFARDQKGLVTHYLLHWPDGQVTLAKKIRR